MADKVLVFGDGWLGRRLASRFVATVSKADVTCRSEIAAVLSRSRPNVVINATGATGTPNIDSCEKDPSGTIAVNSSGPPILADECMLRGIFMAHLGSGCVYKGEKPEYSEDDPPDFFGSVYSRSKALSEAALRNLPVLQLRIRMPFDWIPHKRNLITKLAHYSRIISIPNSITSVNLILNAAQVLIESRKTGVWNVVHRGGVTQEFIMTKYREIVDPSHRFEVITLEELNAITSAGRSNCVLSTAKLDREMFVHTAEETVVETLHQYKGALK